MKMSIDEHLLYEMGYNTGFKDGIKGSIPKDQYGARLKADMVAMLEELQLEIEELDTPNNSDAYMTCSDIIQQKIDKLKGVEDDN